MTRLWEAASLSLAEGISREALGRTFFPSKAREGWEMTLRKKKKAIVEKNVVWGEGKGLLLEEYCRFKVELEKYCMCNELPLFMWVLQNYSTQLAHT